MSRVGLIATNLATAVVTAAVTSLFWIAAYGTHVEEKGRASSIEAASAETPPDQSPPLKPVPMGQLVHGPTGVALPVLGVRAQELTDTFTQARAGGARVHDAIDIMAKAGTPVVAAAPGVVEKIYFSKGGGGNTVYVRSQDGRWVYYYAHLQDYAQGLYEGQPVRQGSPIGRVGSTGNASPDGPHLHFAILRMGPGEKWYQGTPINPYPLLAGSKADR